MKAAAEVITLHEYSPTTLPAAQLEPETGRLLWQQYDRERGVLHVEFPSPRTGHGWRLTPRGWAGFIRVDERLALSLQPRLAAADLFGMLQAAHSWQSLRLLPGLVDLLAHAAPQTELLPALYDRLAAVLADGVLRQARRGLAGSYAARRRALPFVRGRLAPQPAAAPSAPPTVLCDFEEWTADALDNQILAWTLHTIARSGLCQPPTEGRVRRAQRALAGQVTLQPVAAADCLQRRYDRLNAAYAPLHALCHFFLSHSVPSHHSGPSPMSAFLVNMPRLYEQFVAATLRRHLPPGYSLRAQESVHLPGQAAGVNFTIDLVVYDESGAPRAVLDSKYRLPQRAEAASIAQVVAYAHAKQCRRAMLLYPQPLSEPLDAPVGDIRVQTLPLSTGAHLPNDIQTLLAQLTPHH